eukprot:m.186177 g.186177  ORF g.186177 m.186177 type:complete len:63 (+) comp39340_c2_seq19:839-1027(+)
MSGRARTIMMAIASSTPASITNKRFEAIAFGPSSSGFLLCRLFVYSAVELMPGISAMYHVTT